MKRLVYCRYSLVQSNVSSVRPLSERFGFCLTKGQRSKHQTLLSVSAVHQPFHILIGISALPTQHTTFMSKIQVQLQRKLAPLLHCDTIRCVVRFTQCYVTLFYVARCYATFRKLCCASLQNVTFLCAPLCCIMRIFFTS